MKCYCNSGQDFEVCCKPYLSGIRLPETAEKLMRSRYTAYVLAEADYILNTTHPSVRKHYSVRSIKKWAHSSKWIKLEVLSTEGGKETDTLGKVRFKAYYLNEKNLPVIHHEYSTFLKENNMWYFSEGEIL